MSTKQLKKNLKVTEELKQVMNEVGGALVSRKGREITHSKTGDASTLLKLKPTSKLSAETKKGLKELCKQRETSKVRIKLEQEKIKTVEVQIKSTVEKSGISLLEKPKDKVIFAAPYKVHLMYKETAGSIDAEEVTKFFPELIDPPRETLDFVTLDLILSTYEVPVELKKLAAQFKKMVEGLEKSCNETLIKKEDLGLFNIDKYDNYKDEGKITPSMLARFENKEGHYAFEVDKLVEKARCSMCGNPRPKRSVAIKKHLCTRCGHCE